MYGGTADPGVYEMVPTAGGRASPSGSTALPWSPVRQASPCLLGINVFLSMVGTGVLTLPVAVFSASAGIAIIVLCLFPLLMVYTARYVVLASALVDSGAYRNVFAYTVFGPIDENPELNGTMKLSVEEAHAARVKRRKILAWIVDVVVTTGVVALLVLYTRIIAQDMPRIALGIGQTTGVWVKPDVYYLFIFTIYFFLGIFRGQEEMRYVAPLGVSTAVILSIIIFVEYLRTKGDGLSSPAARAEIKWWDVEGIFVFSLPVFATALTFHYNIPPFFAELEVRNPTAAQRAIKWAMACTTVVFVFVGIGGYLTFGSEFETYGNIFSRYPIDPLWAYMRILFIMCLFIIYPVNSTSVRQFLHRMYLHARGRHDEAQDPEAFFGATRAALIAESAVLAGFVVMLGALVPRLDGLTAVIAAFFLVPSSLILPGCLGIAISSGWWTGSRAARRSGHADLYLPSAVHMMLSAVVVLAGLALCAVAMISIFVERANI